MKSIITTYPDFMSLPREIKKLLLASESYFFDEAKISLSVRAPANVSATRNPNQNSLRMPNCSAQ
jgi:hypothetical protein